MSKEAMKLALEALEIEDMACRYEKEPTPEHIAKAITALREALAEQPAQQEPVAWPCLIAEADFSENTVTLVMQCTDYKVSAGKHWLSSTPPPQRTWVGLTDEEISKIPAWIYSPDQDGMTAEEGLEVFARAIEAKLKEKNT